MQVLSIRFLWLEFFEFVEEFQITLKKFEKLEILGISRRLCHQTWQNYGKYFNIVFYQQSCGNIFYAFFLVGECMELAKKEDCKVFTYLGFIIPPLCSRMVYVTYSTEY